MNNFTCIYEVYHLPFVETSSVCNFRGLHIERMLQNLNVDAVSLYMSIICVELTKKQGNVSFVRKK